MNFLEKFRRELAAFRQPRHNETWEQFRAREQREGSVLAIISWTVVMIGACLLVLAELLERGAQ
jgi:hypothetical protein